MKNYKKKTHNSVLRAESFHKSHWHIFSEETKVFKIEYNIFFLINWLIY